MPKAKSSSAYKGTVTVKIKNKNKVKKSFKGRNTGTQNLFRAIALALAGYQVGNNVPTYMCVAPGKTQDLSSSEGDYKYTYVGSVFTVSLQKPIAEFTVNVKGTTTTLTNQVNLSVGELKVISVKNGDNEVEFTQNGETITFSQQSGVLTVEGALLGYGKGQSYTLYKTGQDVPPGHIESISSAKISSYPDYTQSSTPISVTGRSYGQDSQLDWFCRTTATLPKSSFRQSWGSNQTYYAILLNGVQTQTIDESRNVLAYIKLQTEDETPLDLQSMAQGTSLLIEWDLYVQNYDVVKDRVEGGNE